MIFQGGGSKILMYKIEKNLVEVICAMARIRRCLATAKWIDLANDLISGTELEKEL